MTADAFGTAALRHAVVEAWLGSGTRFREDANTEEDHARGYYRDRVVVELAQNAADAAARAGVPGRLLLRLEPHGPGGWRLLAANTGAPLDAAGVASLASLRASAKPAGSGQVGRFGVGFAAVRSVSDDVAVRSRTGGVWFALAATRALLDDVTSGGSDAAARLRAAVAERGDALPVLRLPFEAPALGDLPDDDALTEPDAAYDTVVELVLRDDDAVASVRAQLDAVDDGLLLALPALSAVGVISVVEDQDESGEPGQKSRPQRLVDEVGARWVTERRTGTFDAAELADLPLEQRRADWSLVWALPRPGTTASLADGGTSRVLHAPTPTDVPLTFPALLVASFPVDPGRRLVQPGPASARLAREAGHAYADLLARLATEGAETTETTAAAPESTGPRRDVLALVPTGLPASDLDAAIREAALDALRAAPVVGGVAPQEAVVLTGPAGDDARLVEALAPVVPGLVALDPRHHAVARTLGAATVSLADVVDDLPDGLPPHRWRTICAALEPHVADPGVLEALAGARVPLADGRTVRGVRGTVVLPEDDDDAALAAIARTLGVRVVHPDAAHPVLVRAGAVRTDPRGLLADPGVRAVALAAADALLDDPDAADASVGPGPVAGSIVGPVDAGAQEVVDAVLALVRLALPVSDAGWDRAHQLSDMPFWLGELPVPTADGELAPLRETTLPGTWAADVLDLAVVAPDAAARHAPATLAAAGSHADLAVYTVPDVATPDTGADAALEEAGLEREAPDEEHDPDDPAGWLDGWSDYLAVLADRLGPAVPVGDVEAAADLDAVGDDAWPQALRRLAGEPRTRRVLLAAPRRGVPSYTAWWLRDRFEAPFALHDDVPLLPAAHAVLEGLDDEVRRALGGVEALADLDVDDWPVVLDRLPAVGQPVPLHDALAVWRGLARLARDLDDERRAAALDPLPDRLPALEVGTAVVHAAEDLEVAPGARWAQLGPVVPAVPDDASALADLLDLPVAGEDGVPEPESPGERRELDARVAALDPRLGDHWWAHEELVVDGVAVAWWVSADGEPHATGTDALAHALADVVGRPGLAALFRAALCAPDDAARLWAATAWDAEPGAQSSPR
ncbi:sacsin N-terminal ATP-binding-like domain-containing protein [Isoptericola variabilis]|uniref:ATP-binding region ATPase domain protein n=1 Tax=Isoptericola variabilis (strain 225) TaxID=743718 RepID=F6FTD0_ISOV2|nr:hypothetical protein [Isoptericola variabilis]AEG45294.1 hypothetical protein Isova_2590 [Isoptericola variabilis 225]TWH34794.1 hypothetical protein L600_001000000220 [Isoptericola variabilis J7]